MLTYEDYQLIKELKDSDPKAYELVNKISEFSLDSVSHACHDLRNYAGIIDNYCQLMAMTDPAISQNRYYQKMSDSMQKLISLFDEISRFRYGFKNNMETQVDLADCLKESIHIIQEEFQNYSPNIHLSYTDKDYPFTCKNPYLRDAFIALLRNSIEACDLQNVSLEISLEETSEFYQIVMKDNGTGFSDDMLTNGVTPFVSEKSRHFGLGLSTAAIIILKNDGNYKIHNLDCGSAITITLPK